MGIVNGQWSMVNGQWSMVSPLADQSFTILKHRVWRCLIFSRVTSSGKQSFFAKSKAASISMAEPRVNL
jgi:hypothetical protein